MFIDFVEKIGRAILVAVGFTVLFYLADSTRSLFELSMLWISIFGAYCLGIVDEMVSKEKK